jgi:putative membrane protein
MDASDPRQWQRLAPIALVFLIVRGLQKFIRENLYVFLGAGAGFAFTDWLGIRELLLGALALALILLIGAIIYHRRFRYRLEDDAVRLRRGIWVRRELRVRFARVQNIQISRPFYFRPFGLVRFSLETPGAAEKEVELPGIPEPLAGDIRDRITRHLADEDQPTSGPVEEDSHLLHQPGNSRLFAHGVASNQIWLLAGAAAYVYGTFGRRLEEWLSEVAVVQWLFSQLVDAWYLVAVALVLTVVGLQMLSGLLAIIRFHDFRLLDRGDRVVTSGGLLDRRESTARREKITGIVAGQTMVGRVIGCWHLVVRQASSSEMDGMEGHRKQLIVPGMRRDDLSLIEQLLPGSGSYPRFNPISAGYRQIFWIRVFLVLTAGLGLMVMLLGRDHPGVLVLAGFIPLALAGIHLRWRHWGWARRDGMLWVRQGLLGQQIDVVPMQLVQQARVGQSPYQFRRDLANLELTLPQGNVTIPFIPIDQASELANEAIYVVETSMQHRL